MLILEWLLRNRPTFPTKNNSPPSGGLLSFLFVHSGFYCLALHFGIDSVKFIQHIL